MSPLQLGAVQRDGAADCARRRSVIAVPRLVASRHAGLAVTLAATAMQLPSVETQAFMMFDRANPTAW